MTQSTTPIDNAIRKIAIRLAKAKVMETISEQCPSLSDALELGDGIYGSTHRQNVTAVNKAARILVDADPQYLEQAAAKMFKQAKPKQGGW